MSVDGIRDELKRERDDETGEDEAGMLGSGRSNGKQAQPVSVRTLVHKAQPR